MENEIINRVTTSSLITIDLEQYYVEGERVVYDLKDNLYEGLILREKDFREHVKNFDWSVYKDKLVAITCSADAIIPTWAYMLLATALRPHAKKIHFGTLQELESKNFQEIFSSIDWSSFKDSKVVIKGCSKFPVPVSAYVEAVNQLLPFASSIMYGEPCSTVPLYKRPKNTDQAKA